MIDIANNDEIAKARLAQESSNSILCVSIITAMELAVGCRNKAEQQSTDRFLTQFESKPINEAVSAIAIDLIQTYALSHGLLIPDALIAATAIANDIGLLSKNQRDYRFIPRLALLQYP